MGSRILLADDSITIQKVVNLTFVDEGIDVVTVSNGEMAQRRLAEVNPDLVLADIFMPGKNGYELCQFVKDSPQFKDVPVVLLVGAFEPFDQAEARRVKADGHLTKPFESRTLVETVRNLIQSSKALRPAPPPPVVVAPEPPPPAVDLSELVDGVWAAPGASLPAKEAEASEAAPVTRPLEAPFDLTVVSPAKGLFAASPAQGPGEAWPTSQALPLELSGIGDDLEPAEPTKPEISRSEPNPSLAAVEQEIAQAAHVVSPPATQIVETEPPDANDFRFETLFAADQPGESNGAISQGISQPFDNPDLDFELSPSAEFSADLPQPSERNFAFEAFDPTPSTDVHQPAETKGFDFEAPASSEPVAPLAAQAIEEVSPGIGAEIGMDTKAAATWQSVEPTVTGEEVASSTQGFDLHDEPGVSTPRSHAGSSSATYSFATDDEPLGDLLEDESSAASSRDSDLLPKESHEMPVAEVQAAAAEAFGFDLISESPAEAVTVSEFDASRARINGGQVGAAEPAWERPVAERPATERQGAEVSNAVVGASELDQTVDVAATAFPYAGEERGFAHSLVEDTAAELESGFAVVSEEPAIELANKGGHQHADFFASSFPASEQSKFTSSEMWPDAHMEQAVPDTKAPSPETEAALFSRDAGRPTEPAAIEPDNSHMSETGFEFSQLIDEINEMDAASVAEPVQAPLHMSDAEPVAATSDAAEHSEVAIPTTQSVFVAESVAESIDGPRLEASPANSAERSNGDFSGLSPTTIEEIVRSVVREMSDAVVREIAWEIVPECVERVVERLSREGLSKRVIG
jgi:CheY-like chemotaxis protein